MLIFSGHLGTPYCVNVAMGCLRRDLHPESKIRICGAIIQFPLTPS